jgi:hypothetical protein
LSKNEEFEIFINGLYETPENRPTPGGDLAGIPLLSSYSRLAIFYHDDKDTMIENFVINENTARVQVFDHYGYQDASADFINQVINGDSALGQQTFYLQPMAGVKTALRFPHLQELVKNRKIAINKAEIILKPDANMMDFEGPPPNIVLVKVAADGSYLYTKDHGEDVQGGPRYFYGGWYNELEKEYYFTVTRHLQSVLDGDEIDRGMYILVEGSGITAKRVIFPGPDAKNGIRLRLYYTIVEKENN